METVFAQFRGQNDEDIVKEFRKVAGERFGHKQGSIKKGLIQAMKMWAENPFLENKGKKA